jgi:multiple sugar transport system permease protein
MAAAPTVPAIRAVSRRGTVSRRGQARAGWLMLVPFLVLYGLFLIGPMLYGVVMSFFATSLVRPGLSGFVGVENYTAALRSGDFWWAIWHTALFTVVTTPPLVILSLALAMLVERVRHGRWFLRLVFFAPYVMPSASVALIFGWIYTGNTGLLTQWLSAIGITSPDWLGSPQWAMVSVALMTVWWTLGFNFVLYLAGLQDIPRELYEAAAVDGATPAVQLRRITVPLLRNTTVLVTLLQTLASLKVFDQIYLLTAGGPQSSTRPIVEYIYDVGFTDFRSGYAAAASMLYLVVILLVSAGWLVVRRRQSREV